MSIHNTFENTDDYEIVGNGNIITFNQSPLLIKVSDLPFEDDLSSPLMLKVIFEKNESKSEGSYSFTVASNTLELHIENYQRIIGGGSKEPLKVGHLTDTKGVRKDIFLNFRILGFNQSDDALFFYTLYGKSIKAPSLNKPRKKTSSTRKKRK